MNRIIKQQANIEHARERVFDLITQCIADIQKIVESSDLNMHDIGLKIEMYDTTSGFYYVDIAGHYL